MNVELFYSKQNNSYYCVGQPFCSVCSNSVSRSGLLVSRRVGRVVEDVVFCNSCFSKVKQKGYVESWKIFVCCLRPPKDAFPVLLKIPALAASRGVVDVGGIERVFGVDHVTIDRTRLAGRDSWGGALVGGGGGGRVRELDCPVGDVDAYLDLMFCAKPVLSERKVKRLEEKKVVVE